MKYRLLDILKCPECRCSPLCLEIFEKELAPFDGNIDGVKCAEFCAFEIDGNKKHCTTCYLNEIIEGILFCNTCQGCYPVVDGIPRFYPGWHKDFPHFVKKHRKALSNQISNEELAEGLEHFERLHKATKESFGFQWLKYEVTEREEDFEDFFSKTDVRPEFLKRKLILDAGCGMGRFLMVSARADNEVIGIDLSASVDRAYRLVKNLPFVHVVQGDLMRPPFKVEIFDFIYSIGVLHHTPSTNEAFQSVSELAKKGGRISIWVYQAWVSPELKAKYKRLFARTQELVFDGLRVITIRRPHQLLHYICYIAVPLGWLQMRIQRNIVAKILFWPLLLVYVRGHTKWQIRLLDTFDWYSPKYQWKHTFNEVFGWFQQEGFYDIEKTPSHPIGVTGI